MPPWLLFATGYSQCFLVWHSRPLRVVSSTPAPSSPAALDTAPVLLQHQHSCHAPCWPPGLGTIQNPLGLHTSTDAEHSLPFPLTTWQAFCAHQAVYLLPLCDPLPPCLRLLQCSLSTRHQLPRKQGLCYSPWHSQPLAQCLAQSRSSTSVHQSHSTRNEPCTAVCTVDKARNRLEQVSAFEQLTIQGRRKIRNKQINEQVDTSAKGSEGSQAERCNKE